MVEKIRKESNSGMNQESKHRHTNRSIVWPVFLVNPLTKPFLSIETTIFKQ